MSPQLAAAVTSILRERCGRWSSVDLQNGHQLRVFNIAWGRDMGVDFDHITTNISPEPSESHTIDFFLTSEVVTISDPVTEEILFATSPSSK